MRRGPSLFGIIYIIVGFFVAYNHAYFTHLSTLSGILSAVLAVLLWPLIILGVSLVIAI
jgi:hypothetical protein